MGFLWYNGHPAQVFMGDTGSLALGGILGVCAVLLRRESPPGYYWGDFCSRSTLCNYSSRKLQISQQKTGFSDPLLYTTILNTKGGLKLKW